MPHTSRLARQAAAAFAAATAFALVRPAGAVVHSRTPANIPMSDGFSLAADVYLPPGTGPWPVVLIQTPYNKNAFAGAFLTESARNPLLKSPDYAFVVLDWRGFFASAGAAYSGDPTNGEDGHDAVQWIAAQPWSTGAVGTWGGSALGTVQLSTALERPPNLRACVPMVCHLAERYDIWFPGGVYYKNRNDFVTTYYAIPPTFRNQPLYNLFWSSIDASAPTYSGISTPMLFVSGWYDHETAATLREFNAFRQSQGPASPTRIMIGPWSHGHVDDDQQGERLYPTAEFASAQAALAFFDEHLRGIPQAPTQPVRYFQMNEDLWRESPAWPPTGVTTTSFFLGADALLTPIPPAAPGGTRTYAPNPASPVPSLFGAILQEGAGQVQGPGDVTSLTVRPDTLLYATPPLAAPLRIAGTPSATIQLSTDRPDVDVSIRLLELTPDGSSFTIVDGMRRASLRNSFSTKALLSPGVPVAVPVELSPVAVTIPAGSRLGILVASSNYDLFESNPQDGSNYPDDPGAIPTAGTVTIHSTPVLASKIDLPLLAAGTGVAGWLVY